MLLPALRNLSRLFRFFFVPLCNAEKRIFIATLVVSPLTRGWPLLQSVLPIPKQAAFPPPFRVPVARGSDVEVIYRYELCDFPR